MTVPTPTPSSSSPHLLVRAARGEPVERTPVWAMRQAGRWDPEFNRVRAGMTFYEFSENVEKSAQASLCPRRFGVDGIILFYDITTLPVAMGQSYTLQPHHGPVPDHPIRDFDDLEQLTALPDPRSYQHIRDLLAQVKAELRGELPILVFAGAPFTVATYCIGTGKNIDATRQFAREKPDLWDALLDRLTGATVQFLSTLASDGADMYQLFDSWAGMLTPEEYDLWAQPQHRSIFSMVSTIPRILFVKENPYLDRMAHSGADIISLGKRHSLAEAKAQYPHLVFQGNVDDDLMQTGTPEQVAEATRRCLEEGGGHRHILNLSHGMDRSSPVANFEAFVRTAHTYTPSTRAESR
ncbi:uroporphyrinogen decarboxylase family protein [Tuwongella immobilis]|uniref:Uroporphyrinogen decarboxylase (URO-D) domain-containing protein n=1 Tax=Tuwongella immobilis TaxID=692036 RepID=A0A6C2YSV8_9BACT|nr:uroporphyrinogen decarboxylase family protein [Tuwongella immobilis]VIP04464.1 uroporphyrinogen decarboxylase : Uroporphyrinogen decarboxylase OS=Haladaptatus paucihalophilus DX253 GN=hemE PE=3 SV=1: URO-D [Tuwongella immobilis]VTS06290.1 uroporphyrinogen decarboxylase : Uroporphyrinogen decarboxylase OS=Haladaptatus paucihalophilus DX253 GN=hemE PE=3 SV=1: URO-D [Tuwongella immobilis]